MMFQRLFLVVRSWFTGEKLEAPEDPVAQAQRALAEMRELGVQAIAQEKNLQSMVTEMDAHIQKLEQEAGASEDRDEIEAATKLRGQIASQTKTLESVRRQLEQAILTVEEVREAIELKERNIREKTAEALALKAVLKNSPVPDRATVERALEKLSSKERNFLLVILVILIILIVVARSSAGQ